MNFLRVIFCRSYAGPTSEKLNDDGHEAYRVQHIPSGAVFGWAFGRRIDGERAIKILREIPIDWSLGGEQVHQQISESIGFDGLNSTVCESLMW